MMFFSVADENNSNSDCNVTVQTDETVGDKDELKETVAINLHENRHFHFSVLISRTSS
jgi:hypothetical protein